MRILVLDDDQQRHDAFARNLAKHEVTHVKSAREAVAMVVTSARFDIFFLDHDLGDFADLSGYGAGESTGADFARWMAAGMDPAKRPHAVFIHSWNPDGAKNMRELLRKVAPCFVEPWTPRMGVGL